MRSPFLFYTLVRLHILIEGVTPCGSIVKYKPRVSNIFMRNDSLSADNNTLTQCQLKKISIINEVIDSMTLWSNTLLYQSNGKLIYIQVMIA